jgi:hypothetical protein
VASNVNVIKNYKKCGSKQSWPTLIMILFHTAVSVDVCIMMAVLWLILVFR